MTVIVDPVTTPRYNAAMRETKTARVNAMLKPSVKEQLIDCAEALRLSEADTVAVAIERLWRSPGVQAAMKKRAALLDEDIAR